MRIRENIIANRNALKVLFHRKSARDGREKYVFRLYVAGSTPRSMMAIANLKRLCDRYIPDRYKLTVIDLYQQPESLHEEHVVAAPMLVKMLPLSSRKFLGDLSDTTNLVNWLDLDR